MSISSEESKQPRTLEIASDMMGEPAPTAESEPTWGQVWQVEQEQKFHLLVVEAAEHGDSRVCREVSGVV